VLTPSLFKVCVKHPDKDEERIYTMEAEFWEKFLNWYISKHEDKIILGAILEAQNKDRC
jgi:hypothetical protein